jgi:hypothetical protein
VIECGGLGSSRPVDSLRIAFHIKSNSPRDLRANLMWVREAASKCFHRRMWPLPCPCGRQRDKSAAP